MIKIDFDNCKQVFWKMKIETEGKKLTQAQKIMWLLERGYGISALFSHHPPINIPYLSGVIKQLRKKGTAIGDFKADGENFQTYFLQFDDTQIPLFNTDLGKAS